uniref:Uncharacterized protein n=1 Tax=Romanomermis culicivorax TaxID=13658 RepID=A0A915JQY4_ROMCU
PLVDGEPGLVNVDGLLWQPGSLEERPFPNDERPTTKPELVEGGMAVLTDAEEFFDWLYAIPVPSRWSPLRMLAFCSKVSSISHGSQNGIGTTSLAMNSNTSKALMIWHYLR